MSDAGAGSDFPQTRWSLVVGAAGQDPIQAEVALGELFHRYRYPLYAYLRSFKGDRPGESHEDAEDILQGFFAKLIEKNWLASADRNLGRFRSFLIGTLKHFAANEWRRERAQRRGGGHKTISFDDLEVARRFEREPAAQIGSEEHYDRAFALEILARVRAALRLEYERTGQAELFAALESGLTQIARAEESYASLAARLGSTVPAVKSAMNRLRGRHRQLLRAEVRDIVASNAEVDDELRYLLGVIGRTG